MVASLQDSDTPDRRLHRNDGDYFSHPRGRGDLVKVASLQDSDTSDRRLRGKDRVAGGMIARVRWNFITRRHCKIAGDGQVRAVLQYRI